MKTFIIIVLCGALLLTLVFMKIHGRAEAYQLAEQQTINHNLRVRIKDLDNANNNLIKECF